MEQRRLRHSQRNVSDREPRPQDVDWRLRCRGGLPPRRRSRAQLRNRIQRAVRQEERRCSVPRFSGPPFQPVRGLLTSVTVLRALLRRARPLVFLTAALSCDPKETDYFLTAANIRPIGNLTGTVSVGAAPINGATIALTGPRSEEHTSELQSP